MREEAIAAAANKVAQAGGATALVGGFTASDLAAFGGLAVAVIGVLIQWYYKRKADRRQAELHAIQMEEHRRGG